MPASTQQKHPWKATVRTAFQFIVGLAASWGVVIGALGVDPGLEWVTIGGAISVAITRLMALPLVDNLLPSWLSSDGAPSYRPKHAKR